MHGLCLKHHIPGSLPMFVDISICLECHPYPFCSLKELLPGLQDPASLFHFVKEKMEIQRSGVICLRPCKLCQGQDVTVWVQSLCLYLSVGGKRVAVCTDWITILFIYEVWLYLNCIYFYSFGFFFFKIIYLFYLWLCQVFVSVRGLSLVVASGDHSSSRCTGLSLSRPLLLGSTGSRRAGSVIVAHEPSCSVACGIFPDQGSNPCPLHQQADSQPLRHQGSPILLVS